MNALLGTLMSGGVSGNAVASLMPRTPLGWAKFMAGVAGTLVVGGQLMSGSDPMKQLTVLRDNMRDYIRHPDVAATCATVDALVHAVPSDPDAAWDAVVCRQVQAISRTLRARLFRMEHDLKRRRDPRVHDLIALADGMRGILDFLDQDVMQMYYRKIVAHSA